MKNTKNRIFAISIAILLMLSILVSVKLMPNANAASTPLPNVPTWAYLTVEPNLIGVGQQLSVVMWLYNIPPFSISGSILFQGYTVTVTLPDGTHQTLGPYASDDIAASATYFTPQQSGNYSFVFNFPGQQMNNTYGLVPPGSTPTASTPTFDEYYLPSTSRTVVVNVQTQPIPGYYFTPLPTEYWQAPVEGHTGMYGWAAISGNWLAIPAAIQGSVCTPETQNYNPYSIGPATAHILWRTPIATEGQVGGSFGSADYYTGSSYEEKIYVKIILNGNLYYNLPTGNNPIGGGAVCVNLRTGQQVWWQNITLSFAQLWDFESPNQGGIAAYLWGLTSDSINGKYYHLATGSNTNPVTYSVYDPANGALLTQFSNGVYSGKFVQQTNGEIDEYFIGNNWLAMWNSTLCFQNNGAIVYSEVTGINGQLRPMPPGQQYTAGTNAVMQPPLSWNWNKGMQWNKTVPTIVNQAIAELSLDVIIAVGYNSTSLSATQNSVNGPGWDCVVGYNAVTGAQLWNYTITPYVGDAVDCYSPIVNHQYAYFDQATMTWKGHSALTGATLWGPSATWTTDDNGFWEQSYAGCGPSGPEVANGVMYVSSYAGVQAFNFTDGTLLWTWQSPSTGLTGPYGFETCYGAVMIAGNGLIYQATDEHSLPQAIYSTEHLWCINATTGKTVWKSQGVMSGEVLADSCIATYNYLDGYVYSFGQGLSATTVTATSGQNSNTQVLITGTVTDQSPGQTCLGIPAAGTPAVSDASQDQWMDYLYKQQPEPMNATGVPVTLTYVDSNNNVFTIGTTTTDLTGHYAYTFTPTIPGVYTITATFGGSNAYYSSTAQTSYLYDLPAATIAPTPTPTSAAEMYFVPAIAGLFVLIIIVAIVLALLMLRKRP